MTTFLLMLAAGLVAPNAAPADPAAKAKSCRYTVEQVADRSGKAGYKPGKHAPMHLRAVETRLNGCPVLTDAGSGKMIEPPAFDGRDAKLAPAR